jgi:cyclophilin family peptidyl-prolyl cis-trans isomerase
VFGEVIEGLETAEKISQASTTDKGGDLIYSPEPAIVITSARIIK